MPTAEFVDEILKIHNKYRAQHNAPDLKISDKVRYLERIPTSWRFIFITIFQLNKFAQEWAENLAKIDKSQHRPDNPYGENIYMAMNTDPNWVLKGETVVKSWWDF